jgi:15-cis-phytoene synthase
VSSPATTTLTAAYSHCEAITRTQAANFYYGIRLLPRERREAMSAAYAFARRIDDIGDEDIGDGPHERGQKLARLDEQARALAEIEDGRPASAGDLVMVALADTCTRFSLPHGAMGELIDGVRMDVEGVTYESFDELVLYCRRVAGAIGRVCLAIFGLRDGTAPPNGAEAERLADELGVALQLTNILRDVREDSENGRVYLPREDLRRFGLIGADAGDGEARADAGGPVDGAPEALAAIRLAVAASAPGGGGEEQLSRLAALTRFEAARAREWFDRGLTLAPLLDRRSAACLLAMSGIYRRLLDRIELDPAQAARRRMSLPAHEKAWVAARGMLGGRG